MLKKIISVFVAAVMLASCLAGCSTNTDNDALTTTEPTTAKITDNTTFKLSYTQSDSLDPFKAETQNNQVLASLVFESLFDIDENYELTPNIATGFSYTDSKTLRVDVNQGLKFSNGAALTTDDVAFSIRAAMKSPAYASSLTTFSSVWQDGNSVVISLSKPNPYAVNLLTFPVTSMNDDDDGFPVGNGRYSYKNVDGKTVLKANVSDKFNPYITTINLVNIAAADSIDNAVNIGNISYAFRDMSVDTSKRMSCAKKPVNMNNLVFIGVNSMGGITSNPWIRRAISLAVDRTILSESAYSGYATPASSPFNPYFRAIDKINLFSDSADTATAKQAIAQSGYNSSQLKLSILVNDNENRINAATLIKSQLESVGFSVTINKVGNEEYLQKISNIAFDIYIGEIKLPDDMNLYSFFSEDGGARYGIDDKNLTCADLYEKYMSGDEELGKFILAFNQEIPYIPLLYKKGMICYSKALNGDMQGYYGNYFPNIDSWNFIS